MTMHFKTKSALFAFSVVFLLMASSAEAQITVENSPFIALPTGFTGFEQIGSYGATPGDPAFVGPYTEGGITVAHSGNEKIDTVTQAIGNYSWYDGEINPGYTSIKLADGGNMDEIQFLATSLWYGVGAPAPLQYQILLGGQTIAQGYAGSICDGTNTFCNHFKWYGFSGATFDEVRLQSNIISYPYDWNPNHGDDALVLDNISVHAVPEPATWALMIAGFGLAGGVFRRRRPSNTNSGLDIEGATIGRSRPVAWRKPEHHATSAKAPAKRLLQATIAIAMN